MTTRKIIAYTTLFLSIWNGKPYNAAGTYVDTLHSVTACDTVATLNLVINPLITTTSNVSVCANQLPYIWNGNSYNVAGTYADTLAALTGCDTIATLNLNVITGVHTDTTIVACASFTWTNVTGTTYTTRGVLYFFSTIAIGC